MASLSTLDWTKLVMLVPGLALSYLLVLFVTHYRSAWLKTLMVACYLVAVVATMGEIVFVAYFPQFSTQVTIFYNLFGQLIASLGIVESAQCLYSNARLVYITHTNWTFLKVWIGSCGVLLIPYAAAASHLLRLKYYRFLSITLIIAESVCYGWLMRTMTNMRGGRATMLYYIITILCRLGIVSGIVLRIINGNRDLIGIVRTILHSLLTRLFPSHFPPFLLIFFTMKLGYPAPAHSLPILSLSVFPSARSPSSSHLLTIFSPLSPLILSPRAGVLICKYAHVSVWAVG